MKFYPFSRAGLTASRIFNLALALLVFSTSAAQARKLSCAEVLAVFAGTADRYMVAFDEPVDHFVNRFSSPREAVETLVKILESHETIEGFEYAWQDANIRHSAKQMLFRIARVHPDIVKDRISPLVRAAGNSEDGLVYGGLDHDNLIGLRALARAGDPDAIHRLTEIMKGNLVGSLYTDQQAFTTSHKYARTDNWPYFASQYRKAAARALVDEVQSSHVSADSLFQDFREAVEKERFFNGELVRGAIRFAVRSNSSKNIDWVIARAHQEKSGITDGGGPQIKFWRNVFHHAINESQVESQKDVTLVHLVKALNDPKRTQATRFVLDGFVPMDLLTKVLHEGKDESLRTWALQQASLNYLDESPSTQRLFQAVNQVFENEQSPAVLNEAIYLLRAYHARKRSGSGIDHDSIEAVLNFISMNRRNIGDAQASAEQLVLSLVPEGRPTPLTEAQENMYRQYSRLTTPRLYQHVHPRYLEELSPNDRWLVLNGDWSTYDRLAKRVEEIRHTETTNILIDSWLSEHPDRIAFLQKNHPELVARLKVLGVTKLP